MNRHHDSHLGACRGASADGRVTPAQRCRLGLGISPGRAASLPAPGVPSAGFVRRRVPPQQRGRLLLPSAAARPATPTDDTRHAGAAREAADGPHASRRKPSSLDERYESGGRLGAGQYGVVRAARDRRSGEEVAVKSVSRARPEAEAGVLREAEVMARLGRSLSCCYLYGVYHTSGHVHLVMELCSGGPLMKRLRGSKAFGEEEAAGLVRSIMRTVAQCHECNIAYRDVKPDNFLFLDDSPNSPLKGTDFGLATYLPPGQTLTDKVGTPHYMAPEVIKGSYGLQADVWSAGCIAYQLLSGRRPFADDISSAMMWRKVFRSITDDEISIDANLSESVSPLAREFLQGVLQKDPSKRLTATEALRHPWLQNRKGARGRPPSLLEPSALQRLQRAALLPDLKRELLGAVAREMIAREDPQLTQLRDQFLRLGARQTGGWGSLSMRCRDMVEAFEAAGFDLTEEEERQMVADLSDNCILGRDTWDCKEDEETCEAVAEHDIMLEDFVVSLMDWEVVQKRSRWSQWVSSAFRGLFDVDGTGCLTVSEVQRALPGTSPETIREVFGDTDGTESISVDDFLRLLGDSSLMTSLDLYESRAVDG